VLLADGKKQAISTLKAGQKVLATDTRTGKNKAETITAVMVHDDHDLYDLTVRAGDRTAVIDTTRNHLFWAPDSRRWIKAAALTCGTHLRTPSGDTATVLGGYVPRQAAGWMWDLTIPGDHDFYIDTVAAPILVHNCTISMDEAVNRAVAHVGDDARVVRSGSGGVQFMSRSVDESGNTTMNIARFAVNPNSAHVQELGPHLNLETQINGITVRSGPLADPHLPIDPSTIRPGDYWP
jgi:hypothetical protein